MTKTSLLGAALCALTHSHAFAQEASDDATLSPSPEAQAEIDEYARAKALADAQAAAYEAQTAQYEAQRKAAEAKLGFLPDSPASGTASYSGDKAGQIEARMLVAATFVEAAKVIHKKTEGKGKHLVIAAGEDMSGVELIQFEAELEAVDEAMVTALTQDGQICGQPAYSPPFEVNAVIGAPASIALAAGELIDFLKVDLTVGGVGTDLGAASLTRALMAVAPGRFSQQFSAEQVAAARASLQTTLEDPAQHRRDIARRIAACDTDAKKKQAAAQIKKLAAAGARFDMLVNTLASKETGASPRLKKLLSDLAIQQSGMRVLRLHVESEGGTLYTKKNVATSIGLSQPLSVSGAAVISYHSFDPMAEDPNPPSGYFRCVTGVRKLYSIHGPWDDGSVRCFNLINGELLPAPAPS